MSDDRFEQSADMRLLEHQRRSLGLRPQERTRWRARVSGSQALVPEAETDAPPRTGAVVNCIMTALPMSGLIPGAVVTVSVVLNNDAEGPATGVRLTVPLPAAAAYRPGSLQVDGRDEDARANMLFEGGFPVGELAGGQRKTFLFKLGIRAGIGAVRLLPTVTIESGAVLGALPVVLERSTAPSAFARVLDSEVTAPPAPVAAAVPADDAPAERPFYELDEEELVAAEALDAALAPMTPPPLIAPAAKPIVKLKPAKPRPPEEPALAPELLAEPEPLAEPEQPEPVAAAPEPPAEPEPIKTPDPAVIALPTAGLPTLAAIVAPAKIATLRQFFAPERSFGMTAHYLVLSVLACRTQRMATGPLADFFAAQELLLTRALVMRKMGKALRLDDLAAPLPAFAVPEATANTLELPLSADYVFFRSFKPAELEFLRTASSNEGSPGFVRAAQLAVGLFPDRLASPSAAASAAAPALRDYAAAAATEINRLFVRARLDRRTDIFGDASPELDARARQLLDLLTE